MKYRIKFTMRRHEWQAMCNGKVIEATFNSPGAAYAGIDVQKRRDKK